MQVNNIYSLHAKIYGQFSTITDTHTHKLFYMPYTRTTATIPIIYMILIQNRIKEFFILARQKKSNEKIDIFLFRKLL